jgi:hypothetical protein
MMIAIYTAFFQKKSTLSTFFHGNVNVAGMRCSGGLRAAFYREREHAERRK